MKTIRENELNSLSLNEKLDLILHALGAVEKNSGLITGTSRVEKFVDENGRPYVNKITPGLKACDSDESGNKIQAMVSKSSSFRITPID